MSRTAIIPTADTKTTMFPGDRNTFGLLPGPTECGGTCPCATMSAGGCLNVAGQRLNPRCYVFKTMSFRPAVYGVLKHNTELLTAASYSEQEGLMAAEFERYYKSWERFVARTGQNGARCAYRIHWSGDCFSSPYAHALREAMLEMDGKMLFWGYSRALFTVSAMEGLPNCRWFVSLDDVNGREGLEYLRRFHPKALSGESNISVAYMSEEKPSLPGMGFCPVDSGEMGHEGACAVCSKCLRGTSVWFKLK
jgi:hypothetical protein